MRRFMAPAENAGCCNWAILHALIMARFQAGSEESFPTVEFRKAGASARLN